MSFSLAEGVEEKRLKYEIKDVKKEKKRGLRDDQTVRYDDLPGSATPITQKFRLIS
jgi:hypothetical protein